MSSPRLLIILIVSLIVVGCASGGLRIVETGFSAEETAPTQFAVKLESDQIRSEEEAEANLLVHSARWTIDHSGFYFTISDRIRGHDSEIDLEQASREDGGTGVPTITSGGSGGYTSSTTGKRRTTWSVRATLRIYRDKPTDTDETVYEATRVLDKYRSAQTSSGSRVGAGVSSGY
jgi:hypothetical protein